MARRRRNIKKSVIHVEVDPVKRITGHQPWRSGAGQHQDKRGRRIRTRSAATRRAIREYQ